jgi:hypothetical protein
MYGHKSDGIMPRHFALAKNKIIQIYGTKLIWQLKKQYNTQKKWTMPIRNWSLTISQLAIHFEGRLDDALDL